MILISGAEDDICRFQESKMEGKSRGLSWGRRRGAVEGRRRKVESCREHVGPSGMLRAKEEGLSIGTKAFLS